MLSTIVIWCFTTFCVCKCYKSTVNILIMFKMFRGKLVTRLSLNPWNPNKQIVPVTTEK